MAYAVDETVKLCEELGLCDRVIFNSFDAYVLEYLYTYQVPYASVYGEIVRTDRGGWTTTGEKRTGCVFCAFGAHLEKAPNRFQRLKITHPKLWDYCMRPWEEHGLGMRQVLEYIGIPVE